MSESADVAVATVLITLIIVDIIGNLLVIFIIKKNRDMRSPMDYLLGNLAISDIMVAVFLAPIYIQLVAFTHPEGAAGSALCILLTNGNIAWVAAASSSFTLVATAVERYCMVMCPPGSKWRLNKRKVKVIIFGCWIFAVALNVPIILVTTFDESIGECTDVWPASWMGRADNLTWLVLLSVFPMIVMTYLYFRVVRSLWFKQTDDSNKLAFQQKGVLKVRKRVTLTAIIVTVIFGVCWNTCAVIYFLTDFDIYVFGSASWAVADAFCLFNSAVNPFVYSLLNERFREKVKASFCYSRGSREHPSSEPYSTELQSISRDSRRRKVNEVAPLP